MSEDGAAGAAHGDEDVTVEITLPADEWDAVDHISGEIKPNWAEKMPTRDEAVMFLIMSYYGEADCDE